MYSNHYKVPAVLLCSVNKSVSMVTVISARSCRTPLPVLMKILRLGRNNRTMNVEKVCISSQLMTIFPDVQEAILNLVSKERKYRVVSVVNIFV